jgi:hypothetical protein
MLPPLIAPAAHLTARPRQDFDVPQIKIIAKLRDAWPRRIYSSPSALANGRTAREAEYCLPMDDSELHLPAALGMERGPCPVCRYPLWQYEISPGDRDTEQRSFICPLCGHSETKVVPALRLAS